MINKISSHIDLLTCENNSVLPTVYIEIISKVHSGCNTDDVQINKLAKRSC